MAQRAVDVFPAVVFLQGNSGVKRTQIDGKTFEVWIKAPAEGPARPYKPSVTGTGFFVTRESELYLVTAQHVARAIPFDTTATVRGQDDKALTVELSKLIVGATKPRWVNHDEADVAVLHLQPPKHFQAAIKTVAFGQLSKKLSALNLDSYLTTVGFPLRLGIREKFSPIVKVSHPASGLFRHPRFDNQVEATFFILEDPSVSGFSGAPVFKLPKILVGGLSSPQGPFECVGLVHGTFNDPTGGKFAAIVPAAFIAQTIVKAAKK